MSETTNIKEFRVKGIKVSAVDFDDMDDAEAARYVDFIEKRVQYPIHSVTVHNLGDGTVNIDHVLKAPKFQRIRRITGYLTGDIASWNDAKRAEVKDRVTHQYEPPAPPTERDRDA